jgi:hypothetical protein
MRITKTTINKLFTQKEVFKMTKGYKVFNPDWTCRGFQYEVGETYEENITPKCCAMGFHFCLKASDCFSYCSSDHNNKVAEVVALGEVDYSTEDSKCATNKIQIVREISWDEVQKIANLGNECTGVCNTGNRNTGDWNTGNRNTGNCNTGNWNTGNWNTGNCNTGDWNTGDWNTGNCNTGNWNTGNWNTGNCNTGDWNTGDWNTGNRNTGNCNTGNRNTGNCNTGNWNTGNWNTGNCNTGDWNTGDWNTGNRNTGNCNTGNRNTGNCNTGNWNTGNWNTGNCNTGNRNTGNCNTGDWNTGDYNTGNRNTGNCNTGNCNTGDWNKSSFNNGCFMTEEQTIMMFNKPTDWTYRKWLDSDARYLLNHIDKNVVEWIYESDMSDEEKADNPTYKCTGGYLKVLNEPERGQLWWNSLSDRNRSIIKALPNFDVAIFEQVTGIKVE